VVPITLHFAGFREMGYEPFIMLILETARDGSAGSCAADATLRLYILFASPSHVEHYWLAVARLRLRARSLPSLGSEYSGILKRKYVLGYFQAAMPLTSRHLWHLRQIPMGLLKVWESSCSFTARRLLIAYLNRLP
jgi:hypothetical protein